MKKEELKIKKINTKEDNELIAYTEYETIEKIKQETRCINCYIGFYYDSLKISIEKVIKEGNTQNIDIITILEKLIQIKDEEIKFNIQFNGWYDNFCYTNKSDWILIENFNWILKEINEYIENINKQFEDIKQTIINNNQQIYDLIREDLEKQYNCMVEEINKNINKINKEIN